jgi:hypothetical protein
MKKYLLPFIAILFLTTVANAQTVTPVKKVLELKMPNDPEDSMPGRRGASIAWHPGQKKYYAAMAGNALFPLGIFDGTGKRLSSENSKSKIDTRGLWYNAKKQTICGNGYANNGWFKYILSPKGAVLEIDVDPKDKLQPNDQSVGTYYPAKDVVLFLEGNRVVKYDALGVKDNAVDLKLGLTEKDDIGEKFEWSNDLPEEYNSTTLVFTGIKNAEIGILNTEKKQIELYSYDKGFLTRKIKLPENAPVESAFNFAYTNGMFWLFNMETRLWTAYK